ncbi:hypothetical protein [Schlesneria sp. DSM 10557]|uniref:hypothetical protein n=1 Tax=Schlesneria sp. DSM 10557 TaxID=3044399 RepID=UPI0035A0B9B8
MPTRTVHMTHPESYDAPKKYVLVLSCVDARLLDDLVGFLDHDNLTNRYYHVTLPGTSLGLTDRWKKDRPKPCKENQQKPNENLPVGSFVRKEPCYPIDLEDQFARWRLTFIDQVKAALILTEGQLTDIYIVQHEDCGAFRFYMEKNSSDMSDNDELEMHESYSQALVDDIKASFREVYNAIDTNCIPVQEKMPRLHTFYMDLRGHVTHLSTYPKDKSKPTAKSKATKTPSKPSVRN